MNVGNDVTLQKSLTVESSATVQGSTNLQDGLSVTGDVNVQGGVTSSAPMNAPAFHQTSDYRIKYNLQPIEDALYLIKKLKPTVYEMEHNPQLIAGLIAHEVQEIIQHPVSGEKDGKVLQKIDYIQLLVYLIAAVQEQQKMIETLERKISNDSK